MTLAAGDRVRVLPHKSHWDGYIFTVRVADWRDPLGVPCALLVDEMMMVCIEAKYLEKVP